MKRKYTYNEVLKASLDYFNGDDFAAKVFADKYSLQDKEGNYYELTPDDMHRRLAKEFARIEAKYPNPLSEEEIYQFFKGFKYIVPQGSPMSAIGNPYYIQSVSNCFVVGGDDLTDSYGGICRTDEQLAQISKRRGGVGCDISNIRPKGTKTNNAAKTTDGIGVYMERFSNTIREVGQSSRRGALMLTCSVHHPEILTFITIKQDKRKVTGANISVRLTDEFMQAVKNDTEYEQRFPVDSNTPIISKKVKARDIWNQIIKSAHSSAEPGLLFWDNVINFSPADSYADDGFKTISTNPCLTGDTLVAVADGRGAVSIKELAETGLDVPVYTTDEKGNAIVRLMRNPRKTGSMLDVYTVTIEGGYTFKATGNHKIPLLDGRMVEVKDLISGDQMQVGFSINAKFHETQPNISKTKSQNYVWWKGFSSKNWKAEHTLIWEFYNNKKVENGHVIHHNDFNALNNNIDNLKCLSKQDHHALHAKNMLGDKNPMRRAQTEWSDEKWQQYRSARSQSVSTSKNINWIDVSNETIYAEVLNLTKQLGTRITASDWTSYAKDKGYPTVLTASRLGKFTNFMDLTNSCASAIGVSSEVLKQHKRAHKAFIKAEEMGYVPFIKNNQVYVVKQCKNCNKQHDVSFSNKKVAYCSVACARAFENVNTNINDRRSKTLTAKFASSGEETKSKQLDIYTKLRFELKRLPKYEEWVSACISNNCSYSLKPQNKNGFKRWSEVQKQAELHNHRIVSVEYSGKEDVYNGTVDDVHNFYIGGWRAPISGFEQQATMWVKVKNCGELPLSCADSCRLMTLNLYSYVKSNFLENSHFDYDMFYKDVQVCQRLMDDLVDLELEAINRIIGKIKSDPEPDHIKANELSLWTKIQTACKNGRRTGTGITALGDALAAINVRYGSTESVEVTEKIYKTLALGCYRATVDLAKERGVFPVFSHEKESNNPFLNRIWEADSELYQDYLKYGRRNIALTTTAPTGSVSTQTQTTSGIEPSFLLSYTRRKKINPNDKNARVDFTDDLGDRWQEFAVYHHHFKTWMDVTGKTNVEESPYWKATSKDIDWVTSVDMQAAAQRWICHSISKTCNLPNDTSVELVGDIYLRAWESGCKGFTVYREGSRDGVLVSNDNKNKTEVSETRPAEIKEAYAPKRPKELPCDIHRMSYKGQKWIALVGLMNGIPYELFTGFSETLQIPSKHTTGIIKKMARGVYALHIEGEDSLTVNDLVKSFDNSEFTWATRMISTSLRHGVPTDFLVEQLGKEGNITDINKVLSRVLKKYIKEGTKNRTSAVCESCGSKNLIYSEGCLKCADCPYFKCG